MRGTLERRARCRTFEGKTRLTRMPARAGSGRALVLSGDCKIQRHPVEDLGSAPTDSAPAEFELLRESTDQAQSAQHPSRTAGEARDIVRAEEFVEWRITFVNPLGDREWNRAGGRLRTRAGNRCIDTHGKSSSSKSQRREGSPKASRKTGAEIREKIAFTSIHRSSRRRVARGFREKIVDTATDLWRSLNCAGSQSSQEP